MIDEAKAARAQTSLFYKKLIVVLVVLFAAMIISAVLATYFAKRPKEVANPKLLEYICQNLSYIKEINDYCQGTTTPPPIDPILTTPIAQLPNNLIPTAYDLIYNFYTSPTDEPDYFNCDETVYFTCQESTDTIVMHMKDLTLDNSSFILTLLNDSNPYSANQIRSAASWTYDPDKQFIKIKFGQYVLARNTSYSLRLVFQSRFRNDGSGLFKSSYINQQKSTRWLVVLEAQPASARKAFVCFDEPQYKAKYKIVVSHNSGLNVWSNMPTRIIENANISLIRMRTEFQRSPMISSNLLGLVMSDFKCPLTLASVGTAGSTNVSVCSAPDSIAKVEYSLGLSKSLFEFFEGFFNFKFPVSKSDLFALPQQSCQGKSNWGLIYMKDEIVFNDAKTFSQGSLIRNIIQLSRQISQQWLGNLVSLRWWDDYWLFDSINSYISYLASNKINPGISILEQQVIKQMNTMNDDAINPLMIDTSQTNLSFSDYLDEKLVNKGSSLMRMANYMLGVDAFSNGTVAFLKMFAYSTAKQNDFWNYFSNISSMNGFNLSTIMYSWTRQSGHPIVTVKRFNTTHISVSQAPFSIASAMEGSQKWYIPFSYVIVDNITTRNEDLFNVSLGNFNSKIVPITPTMNEIFISVPKPMVINQSYVVANLDAAGFYRVNYDAQNWDLIIQQLMSSKKDIPARNRAQFINDLFAFAQANLVDPLRPFTLLAYMVNEDEYLPWQSAIKQIYDLKDLVDALPIYGLFRSYVIRLVSPIYNKLNWTETLLDTWLDKLLRISIMELACEIEIQDCIQKSLGLFKSWTIDSSANSIPIAFQRFIYCKGIEYGTADDWKFMFNQFTLELDPTLKDNLLYGLSCSRQPWIIQTYLDNQISPDFFVSNQTIISAVTYASSKSSSYLLAWQFVKKNWDRIQYSFGGNPAASGDFLRLVTRKFATQELLDDLSKFFQDKRLQTSANSKELERSRNRISLNLKWLKNVYDPLSKWLANQ